MKILAPTRIIRTTVSQEVRVILPPLNMVVNEDNGKMPVEADFRGEPDLEYEMSKNLDEWKAHYFQPSPAENAPANAVRRIQLLIPTNPQVFGALDHYPELIGPNRGGYKLPPLVPGQQIRIHLLPHQWLVAGSAKEIAHTSVIVEYVEIPFL